EDELARRVDHAVGGRQELLGRQRDDAPVLDRDGGVDDIASRDHAAALDDEIDRARGRGHLLTWGAPTWPPPPPHPPGAPGHPGRPPALPGLTCSVPSPC